MPYTTPDAVEGVLGPNYGPGPDGSPASDLQQYIDTANSMVQQANAMARGRNLSLSGTTLELMERWLAAYYYTQMDPIYQSRSSGGASGSFVSAGQGADPNRYRQTAIELDWTGSLNALLKRQQARGFWAGSDPRQQRPPGEC